MMTGRFSITLKRLLFLATALGAWWSQTARAQDERFADAKDALDISPFASTKADPHFQYLLKIVEYGTVHQKHDLLKAVEEQNGSIDWLHLLLYDPTEIRYPALRAISERGAIESVPHLLNSIERTYEEADYGEVVSHADMRGLKAQQSAVEAVEAILGEPILEAGSAASGASRSILGFVGTHGYRNEMKAAVLKAERLLDVRDAGGGIAEPSRREGESLEAG